MTEVVYVQEPKCRGMILEPEHDSVEPPEVEVEDGAGNTETEAPESTRKRLEES